MEEEEEEEESRLVERGGGSRELILSLSTGASSVCGKLWIRVGVCVSLIRVYLPVLQRGVVGALLYNATLGILVLLLGKYLWVLTCYYLLFFLYSVLIMYSVSFFDGAVWYR